MIEANPFSESDCNKLLNVLQQQTNLKSIFHHLITLTLLTNFQTACPAGFYGKDCFLECDCGSGGGCDAVTGECAQKVGCPVGKTGPNCLSGWLRQICFNIFITLLLQKMCSFLWLFL